MRNAALILLVLGLSTIAAGANIVQNPGFELGLTNWTVAGPGVSGFNWQASAGAHSGIGAARDGCTGASCITGPDSILYQDLATVVGQSYVLSFWAGSGSGAGPNALRAVLGGTVMVDLVNFPNAYTLYTAAPFVATSTTTRLEFYGRNDPAFVQLDDVSVDTADIPEPGTAFPVMAAVLLFGLGVIRGERSSRR